jgi:hypothetical protein
MARLDIGSKIRQVLAAINSMMSPTTEYRVHASGNGGYDIIIGGKKNVYHAMHLSGILSYLTGVKDTYCLVALIRNLVHQNKS